MEAINDALRALRKRHLLEEGAHAPAISALSKPLISQVILFCSFLHCFRFHQFQLYTLLSKYTNC
jgi:hypothetical protein